MASEIEVVMEEEEEEAAESRNHAGEAAVVEDERLRDDVYTAAAYGDIPKLQRLVESDGCSVAEPDALGYYALQWAALNNRAATAHYIIQVQEGLLPILVFLMVAMTCSDFSFGNGGMMVRFCISGNFVNVDIVESFVVWTEFGGNLLMVIWSIMREQKG